MGLQELKDHYRTLGIEPSAKLPEVKQAYRKLAMKYHPDKNTSIGYAEVHFREIKEAYDVLSNPGSRKVYDEERWLNGMGARARDQVVITPAWILKECVRLSKHIDTVDTYRMSHGALTQYIALLVSDAHMSVLLQTNDAAINTAIVTEILKSTRNLHYAYMHRVGNRLAELAGKNEELLQKIKKQIEHSKKQYQWARAKPIVITIVTLLLCLLMYWYVRW